MASVASARIAQKQRTYELFLSEALKLFAAKGYVATTVDDIVTAAGTTRATFYLHFSSKADLMGALMSRADQIMTAEDDPPLTAVIESGSRSLIRAWLDRKMHQWDEVRPHLVAAVQAVHEPVVAERTEAWFADIVDQMQAGLDRAGRHAPDRRRIRCVLAFGQLEFLTRRYYSVGWVVPRDISLDEVTDSWCYLLA
jgi:AcrR family transcriptional regulator